MIASLKERGFFIPRSGWWRALFMVCAGALGALALPPVYALPVLPFSLGALYFVSLDEKRRSKVLLWAFLYGMGFHIAGLYWLTNAILTRVNDFWWVVPFAAPGVAVIIAPLMAVPAFLCRYATSTWQRVLVFAGGWTLADMSRVFFFSGFPWNPIGSALEFPGLLGDVLIQPASLIGVDGEGLLLVLASLFIWMGRKWFVVVVMAAALLCFWSSFRLEHAPFSQEKNPYLIIAQGNVTETDVLDREGAVEQFRDYLALTRKGVLEAQKKNKGKPIVVVWPESAFPGVLDEDIWAQEEIASSALGAAVLVGSDRRAQGHWYNSLEAVVPNGTIKAIYDKSRLVPFGEYQPWIIPFNILPSVLTPGTGLQTWDLPETGRVGPMVCYEIIFSGSVVSKQKRPNWLLTISNDAWYGDSAGPRQHLATGRMRAVEEGIPVAFVNNRGISAVYDSFGHEIDRTEWGKKQTLPVDLPLSLSGTIFSKYGRSITILISFSMIFTLLFGRKKKLQ